MYMPLIHAIMKIIMQLFCMVFIIWKWKDIKEIFCEKGGEMSSKRVIALMGMITLCRLALYTTASDDDVDNNILAVLTIIVITACSIATFPQVMDLFAKIKSIGTKEEVTKNLNVNTKDTTVVTTDNNAEDTTGK